MKLIARFEQVGDRLTGCTVSGHAAWDGSDSSGQILCAAVSSAMQLTCNTLTECFHADADIQAAPAESEQNRLSIRLRQPDTVQSELLHGLLIHLQALAEDFDGLMTVELCSTE